MNVPSELQEFVGIELDSNPKNLPNVESYYIDVKSLSIPSPCSPSLTGASTTTPLPNANGTAEWGRVDFWDYTGSLAALDNHDVDPLHDPSPPLCTTPHPYVLSESYKFVTCPTAEEEATLSEDDLQWLPCEQRVRDYEIQHGLNTAYALCSHKDGKTVVICISQMTQNEPLAKQIFDTFRWTK